MNNTMRELLIINRMIMFLKLIYTHLVDSPIYLQKIIQDLNFINTRLECILTTASKDNEELKEHSTVYKNIFRKLIYLVDDISSDNQINQDENFNFQDFSILRKSIKSSYESLITLIETGKAHSNATQYINENEYTMLLSQLEE